MKADSVQQPLQTKAGSVQQPLRMKAGRVQQPLQMRAGSVQQPLHMKAGSVQQPLHMKVGNGAKRAYLASALWDGNHARPSSAWKFWTRNGNHARPSSAWKFWTYQQRRYRCHPYVASETAMCLENETLREKLRLVEFERCRGLPGMRPCLSTVASGGVLGRSLEWQLQGCLLEFWTAVLVAVEVVGSR